MRKRIVSLASTFLLAGSLATALPQEPAEQQASLLDRAVALSESEGPLAAIELIEAARSQEDLDIPTVTFLGMLFFTVGRAEEAYQVLEPITRSEQTSPAVLFNAWRAAEATGRGEERLDLLTRAAAAAPVSPAARQLGFVLGNRGQIEDAYLLLVPWARAQPDDVEARLAAAHAALQLRRVPVAEEMLGDLSHDIPQVRLLWGKAQLLRGDPFAAIETLETLGEVSDLSAGIDLDRRHTMANAYVGIGQAAEAVKLLEGRTASDPRLILVLGRAQSQTGQMAAAVETLEPLAKAVLAGTETLGDEMAGGVLLDYGRALIATGSQPEAIEPLQRASQLDPDNEMVWQSLGQALAVAGRREEATAALERFNTLAQSAVPATVQQSTLESDVDDPTARELREALKLVGQGQTREALEVVRAEARMSPGDPRVPLVASQILVLLEQRDNALEAASDAMSMAPEFPDAHYQYSVVLMGLHRLDEAEAGFMKTLELAPTHTPAMNDLAVLFMLQERNDEARALLERILEINPEDPLAAENLASLDG